jgi:hypothetical protein
MHRLDGLKHIIAGRWTVVVVEGQIIWSYGIILLSSGCRLETSYRQCWLGEKCRAHGLMSKTEKMSKNDRKPAPRPVSGRFSKLKINNSFSVLVLLDCGTVLERLVVRFEL